MSTGLLTTSHIPGNVKIEHRVLLARGVGRIWAGANLGGVLCGSSKKSYHLSPKKKKKKDSHSRERFRVLQQSRVELLFAGANQGLSWLPVKA